MSGQDRAAILLDQLGVSRETMDRLDVYVAGLIEEAARQNLVSKASLADVWDRHILDSLQLISLAPPTAATWLDIGSGAGLPGLIIAATRKFHVTLVEPRRLRTDFLSEMAERMAIVDLVDIVTARAETLPPVFFDAIGARAVANLDRLFTISIGLSHPETCLIFPKGRGGAAELEAARGTWQGDFRIERSITDPEATIIVARHLARKGKA